MADGVEDWFLSLQKFSAIIQDTKVIFALVGKPDTEPPEKEAIPPEIQTILDFSDITPNEL